jgi:hypothetical protein
MSLGKVYETSFEQALEMVRRNGGEVDRETVRLPSGPIEPVRLETSFPGMHPVERRRVGLRLETTAEIAFEGVGYVLTGGPEKMAGPGEDPYVHRVEVRLDGREPVVVALPVDERVRRLEVAWGYGLAAGRHTLRLTLLEPRPGDAVGLGDIITYGEGPARKTY